MFRVSRFPILLSIFAMLLAALLLQFTATPAQAQASTDATLSGLTASRGTSATATFQAQGIGTFSSTKRNYRATVAATVTHFKLTPTTNNSGASVKVGKEGTTLATVTSGSASAAISLNQGRNVLLARVTAADGTTMQTYTVVVIKRPAAPTGLSVRGGDRWLNLLWTAPTGNVSRYEAHFTSAPASKVGNDWDVRPHLFASGAWVRAGHVPGGAVAMAIPNLAGSTTYRVRVRTADAHSTSDWVYGSGRTSTIPASSIPSNITVTTDGPLREGGSPVTVRFTLDRPALGDGGGTIGYNLADRVATILSYPKFKQGKTVASMTIRVPEDDIDNNCRKFDFNVIFGVGIVGAEPIHTYYPDGDDVRIHHLTPNDKYLSADVKLTAIDNDGTADSCDTGGGGSGEFSGRYLGSTEGEDLVDPYDILIRKIRGYRNDPQYVSDKAHTDRWDRVLKAFGISIPDDSLPAMSSTEAKGYADRGWTRWVEVAKALKKHEDSTQQPIALPDPVVTITSDTEVTEGEVMGFALHANPAPVEDISVSVTISQSGAFVDASALGTRTLTIRAGAEAQFFAVATVDDTADEPNGSVSAEIVAGSGYAVGDAARATVAVSDNDEAPQTTVTQQPVVTQQPAVDLPSIITKRAMAREGSGAAAVFTVRLSRKASQTVTVNYATANGSGLWAGTSPARAGADYTSTSGTLSFAAGQTLKSVSVPIIDDSIDEGSDIS